MNPHCDICGRFVGSDALVVSAFIPPPCEGMEDTIYCPRCTPDPAPAGGPTSAQLRPAGATKPTEGTVR